MTLANRIQDIQKQIAHTALQYHRAPNTIQILAVSKGQNADMIHEAYDAGLRHFGESYWQEAAVKISNLRDLNIHWHFIGPIQSNKAKDIAMHFDWVHSVSREKIARLLSEFRGNSSKSLQSPQPLQVCIQVNLDDEKTKSGVHPEELLPLARIISTLPELKLRGLMTIPKIERDEALQYAHFLRLKVLLEECNQSLGLSMDTLSMGMSDDWVQAVAAGSTMLRIGRAIFGER
jgi:pyridoxal phosphate enzyme (YggS family)